MIQEYQTRLTLKRKIGRNVYFLRFRCLSPKKINFRPGQYLILKVPTKEGTVSRLYSIASPSSEKKEFTLIVKLINRGIASRYFARLNSKSMVTFQGPAGFFNWQPSPRKKTLVATGTGIVPFLSMLTSLDEERKIIIPTHLFWGLADFEDIFFEEKLKQLAARNSCFTYQICLSRAIKGNSQGRQNIHFGRLTKPLLDYLKVKKNFNSDFYLCGRYPIVEAMKNVLRESNINEERIFFEKFNN